VVKYEKVSRIVLKFCMVTLLGPEKTGKIFLIFFLTKGPFANPLFLELDWPYSREGLRRSTLTSAGIVRYYAICPYLDSQRKVKFVVERKSVSQRYKGVERRRSTLTSAGIVCYYAMMICP